MGKSDEAAASREEEAMQLAAAKQEYAEHMDSLRAEVKSILCNLLRNLSLSLSLSLSRSSSSLQRILVVLLAIICLFPSSFPSVRSSLSSSPGNHQWPLLSCLLACFALPGLVGWSILGAPAIARWKLPGLCGGSGAVVHTGFWKNHPELDWFSVRVFLVCRWCSRSSCSSFAIRCLWIETPD